MGGAVKVAFRLHDGTVTADTRWTNAVPHKLTDPMLVADDAEYLREYAYAESDYRSNGEDVTVSPTGYGLIVVDAITHTIYSGNGYCTPGEHNASTIMRNTRQDPEAFKLWDQMMREGRLSVYRFLSGGVREPYPGFAADSPLTVTEEARSIYHFEERANEYTTVVISLAPWTVRRFSMTPDLEMLNALVEGGFPLTDLDRLAWNHWFRDQENEN
jgi:hypothetical protein